MRKYFLIFAFWKLTNMYLNGYEKGWPLFCPFKPYWWVHSNISGIFEQFSIRLCIKNMKTQETFKKKSGHTPVLCVRKYFLISAFWKLTNMYLNGYEKGWPLFCPFKPNWWVHSNISGIFEQFSIRLCVRRSLKRFDTFSFLDKFWHDSVFVFVMIARWNPKRK